MRFPTLDFWASFKGKERANSCPMCSRRMARNTSVNRWGYVSLVSETRSQCLILKIGQ